MSHSMNALQSNIAKLTEFIRDRGNTPETVAATRQLNDMITIFQNEVSVTTHPYSSTDPSGLDQDILRQCRDKWGVEDGLTRIMTEKMMANRIKDLTNKWYGHICLEIRSRGEDPGFNEKNTLLAIGRALLVPNAALVRGQEQDMAVDQRPGLEKLKAAIGYEVEGNGLGLEDYNVTGAPFKEGQTGSPYAYVVPEGGIHPNVQGENKVTVMIHVQSLLLTIVSMLMLY